ncbi:alanine and glycine-rich protein-like [Prorops nasuta]|uniref:alanine and glycine-rich protein-like n=1 Tax=Prorops nasuta TaxID=863751 RepID=UPI0034CF16B8
MRAGVGGHPLPATPVAEEDAVGERALLEGMPASPASPTPRLMWPAGRGASSHHAAIGRGWTGSGSGKGMDGRGSGGRIGGGGGWDGLKGQEGSHGTTGRAWLGQWGRNGDVKGHEGRDQGRDRDKAARGGSERHGRTDGGGRRKE